MDTRSCITQQASRTRHRRATRFILLCLAGLFLLGGCGYHLTSIEGIVPPGAKTIAIPAFINNTLEPYVDVDVTKAVAEEFLTDGRLKVVGADTADLVLRGRVTRFDLTPQAYTADSHVQAYSVGIGVIITIENAKTQQPILKDAPFSSVFISTYAVTLGDISQTKIAKDAAMKSACKDLAASVRSRVLEGF
jgi:hypothetical protein